MYLTVDESNARLNSPANLVNSVVEYRRKNGRPTGSVRLSPAARQIVAQAARVLPPIRVAEMFGITRRTASNLSRGITSNVGKGRQQVNEDLKESTDQAAEERTKLISARALDILVATLEGVDPTKVKSQTAKVRMAKDLATIHEKMTGQGHDAGMTKVLIYAPRQRDMKDYDIMDISAKVMP